ncbi:type II secretion system F family protein [Kineococcus rubinsiae]|uniref:type II secretion system F family protein n=1 Tax=Kineococcus rubinsiae TaxID=2609562 RepID=UPI00142FB012|nr:type II secretion system F family protein [Kineococcus rubinsiae]NIZ90809.1 type II secretion system F family protein [Kineococcus rubinsiae]
MTGVGAGLGLVGGLGLLLVLLRLPWWRRLDLADRVGPYLADAPPAPEGAARRLLASAAGTLGGWLGSSAAVRQRLQVLDPDREVPQFRAEQVLWALAGAAAAGGGVAALAVRQAFSPLGAFGLLVAGALAGALARDHLLGVQVRRRRQQLLAEFPVVAELLALSVGAGENVVAALERVATGDGALCADLRRALADVRTGTGVVTALEALAARTQVPELGRFVDGMAVAIDRGTPLADVLRAQAADAREDDRRRLLEAGGRKEVLMMVPVVFVVLPVTVVFAVFPGLAVLQVGP